MDDFLFKNINNTRNDRGNVVELSEGGEQARVFFIIHLKNRLLYQEDSSGNKYYYINDIYSHHKRWLMMGLLLSGKQIGRILEV